MNEIPIAAQQLIIDNIKARISSLPRVVLCHDAGSLTSEETCQVCTHDKFEDHIFRNSIELVSVFPSVGQATKSLHCFLGLRDVLKWLSFNIVVLALHDGLALQALRFHSQLFACFCQAT